MLSVLIYKRLMNEKRMNSMRETVVPKLKVLLKKNKKSASWASERLQIHRSYMSQMMNHGLVPSLQLAFKINELAGELMNNSSVS